MLEKLDWKHIAIMALFVAVAVVVAVVPKAAGYVTPLVPVLGALALGKQWAPADEEKKP